MSIAQKARTLKESYKGMYDTSLDQKRDRII